MIVYSGINDDVDGPLRMEKEEKGLLFMLMVTISSLVNRLYTPTIYFFIGTILLFLKP